MDWVLNNIELILALVIPVAAGLSAAFPSTNKVMKVIDIFAINWGKARNDPKVQ